MINQLIVLKNIYTSDNTFCVIITIKSGLTTHFIVIQILYSNPQLKFNAKNIFNEILKHIFENLVFGKAEYF